MKVITRNTQKRQSSHDFCSIADATDGKSSDNWLCRMQQRVAIYYYLVTRYVIIIIIIAEDINERVAAWLKLSYKFRILMILSG